MLLAFVLASSLLTPVAHAQDWTLHGGVVSGEQFDMVPGPTGRLHLITSRYYELDRDGGVLVAEDVGDSQQGGLDFPPAIAVSEDGAVHIVTREGGDYDSGHTIRYRRRRQDGSWDRSYTVGLPQSRNYVVGAAVLGGAVILSSTQAGDDVWGDVHLWQASESSATQLGSISGIWRADCGTRMRSTGDRLFLASGVPDPDGRVYLMSAGSGGDLVGTLQASLSTHSSGSGRKGFADLYLDDGGRAHLSYGAFEQVYYARYGAGGSLQTGDALVASDLGEWHLSAGLSALAASDDGQTVVAVVLRSDGSQSAGDSDLLWTMSSDGGASWSALQDLGVNTSGGEGRMTPRMAWLDHRFLLVYAENSSGDLALATLDMPDDEPGDSDPPVDDSEPLGDDTGDSPEPADTDTCDACPGDDDDDPEGCGCAARSPATALWWLPLVGAAVIRRRPDVGEDFTSSR